MTEMLIPAKYADDIDKLRNGHHGWHGFRHRLAWAVAPDCIRALMIAGLMVSTHPDEVMNALFDRFLNDFAAEAANEDEEAHR
ncbi:MAG: hypothetical protein ACFN4K_05760 [Pauljensenia sp.]